MNSQPTLPGPARGAPSAEHWDIPPDWDWIRAAPVQRARLAALAARVAHQRETSAVYPAPDQVFAALHAAPWTATRVVILGQDPYHGPGQAHGLSFSVPPGIPLPPSLRNIYRELRDDLGIAPAAHGCLSAWARQGVLLLNATLTVRAGEPNSHAALGWEEFSDELLREISARKEFCVFILWGNFARRKKGGLDPRHRVLESAHPSPLAARHGFFGSRVFSRCNQALQAAGLAPIDWQLPANPGQS